MNRTVIAWRKCLNGARFSLVLLTLALTLLTIGCASDTDKTQPVKLSEAPNQEAANYNLELGIAYLQQGDVAKAQRKLQLAEAQAPHWPPVLDGLGYFYETTGQVEKAKAYFLKALALSPRAGATNNNYGTFLCREKHYHEAIERFEKAASDPNYTNAAEAYENAGLCATLIPDRKLAYHYFHKAFERDSTRPLLLLKLAEEAYEQKHYQQAKLLLARYTSSVEKPSAAALQLTAEVASQLDDALAASLARKRLVEDFPGHGLSRTMNTAG